jgi:DNA/RNA endonuclease YhcR with UshA esterase domain
MKKGLILSLTAFMVLSVFVLSSCFSPAPKVVTLGTSIYDATSGWSTDTAVSSIKGVVIGYPGRKIGSNYVGGFSSKLFIEDEKGGVMVYNSGLNETYDATPSSYNFKIGDVVTVSGTLTDYYGNFEVTPSSTANIVKTGDTFDVKPDDLTTASTLTGENLRLVKLSGTATNISNKSFDLLTTNLGTITVKDYTYGKILDFDTIIANGDNVDVTGIVYTSYGNYIVYPRIKADIVKK